MHKFSHENTHRLETPARYELLTPETTLRRFGLREGMTFVDVGAGSGFFSRPASALVGPHGKVVAVDTSAAMLENLRGRGVPANMITVQSDEQSIPLPDGSADFLLLAFVLHEIEDKIAFLSELKRLLKPGGSLLLLEWKRQTEESGPPESERMTGEELTEALGGWTILEQGSLNSSHRFVLIR